MKNPVRVRFAPSPTGLINIGGMRSALFNWLYAQKHQGQFYLRLEDTDRQRLVPEAVEHIKTSHQWLGLTPDGIVTQSERLELYQTAARRLVDTGALYPCWCTPERLDHLRQQAQASKQPFKYDRHCLASPSDPGQPHVLRFRIPETAETIGWADAVKGQVEFKPGDLDDFVALKSDGYPTYHLANVVDDHDMQITHVLRADEWLPSTPKHLLLYQAFGWQPPVFAHLPAVLGKDGTKKLSKRHGAKDILQYRNEGYLPEAVINYMALLGWNPGEGSTQEIFSCQELIEQFDLGRVQKSPAVFDAERLDWMNGLYIRQLPAAELAKLLTPFAPDKAAWQARPDYALAVTGLIQERLKRLGEASELAAFFFTEPSPSPAHFATKQTTAVTARRDLADSLPVLTTTAAWQSVQTLEAAVRAWLGDNKPGPVFMALRIAITGQSATPPLFETMFVLGQERVLRRINAAIDSL